MRADPNAVEASRLDARETVDMLLPTPAGWVAADFSAASGAELLAMVLLEVWAPEVVLPEVVLPEVVLPEAVRPGGWTAPLGEPQTSQ